MIFILFIKCVRALYLSTSIAAKIDLAPKPSRQCCSRDSCVNAVVFLLFLNKIYETAVVRFHWLF